MSERKVGTGVVPIRPDTKGFGKELEQGLNREGEPAAKRSGDKIATAAKGAFAAGVATIGKSVFDFASFDKQMREVFTLLPGISGDAMSTMTDQVKDFSTEFNLLPTQTVPALYEALGAGVPADNVFTFLEQAQKLAVGGVTELNTAVDGLSSVVNAYGEDVVDATKASDIMFKIVGLGKGTLDDVAGALFNVTPIASALGVSFEDVGAAMAVLSSKGVPVRESTTQIRAMLSELGKDGTKVSDIFEEMAGKSFQQFIAGGGNMSDALQLLDDAAQSSGLSVMDLFGSIEAGSAALALLSGDGAAFSSAIEQMGNAAGSTQAAYDTMNRGLSVTMDKLKAKFAVTMLNIGESIAPTFDAVGTALAGALELFSKLPGPMQATVVMLGTITAGIVAFARPLTAGIKLFGQLGSTFKVLAANPWVIVLLAIATVTLLVIKHWDKLVGAARAVGRWIGDVFATIGRAVDAFMFGFTRAQGNLTGGFAAIADFAGHLRDAWEAIFAKMSAIVAGFVDGVRFGLQVIGNGFTTVGQTVQTVFGAIVSTITGAWDIVTTATSTAWDTATTIVTTAGGAIVDFLTAIPRTVGSAFSTLAEVISAPFRAAFDAIRAVWNSTVGGFGFTLPSWIPGLGGKSFTIPSMAFGGVLTGPQLVLAGEYPGAARNPEVVAPQSIIRETLIEALAASGPPGAGGEVLRIDGPLIGHAEIRGPGDIVDLSRELARELDRRRRGSGIRQLAGATS